MDWSRSWLRNLNFRFKGTTVPLLKYCFKTDLIDEVMNESLDKRKLLEYFRKREIEGPTG